MVRLTTGLGLPDMTTTIAQTVQSPCILVCTIDPKTQQCLGCARTLKEISAWPRMTAEEQASLLAQLKDRHTPA